MGFKFVESINGNDANDGLDNVGFSLTTATYIASTKYLTQTDAFLSWTYFTGAQIYISGGTGATPGLYPIVARISKDTIELGTALAGGDLGTGDITSSNGPWKTVTHAVVTPGMSSGDVCLCQGSESPTTTIIPTTALNGSLANGLTTIKGVGPTWEFDGTKFTIDASGVVSNTPAMRITAMAWFAVWGFEIVNTPGASSYAIQTTSTNYALWVHDCKFNNNAGRGFSGGGMFGGLVTKCSANNNGGDPFLAMEEGCLVFACEMKANSGIANGQSCVFLGCIIDDSTSHGFSMGVAQRGTHLVNCVINANGGVGLDQVRNQATDALLSVLGCRITNGPSNYAFNPSNALIFEGWNVTAENSLGTAAILSRIIGVPNTSVFGDTPDGYTDEATKDFNLTSNATNRRQALVVGAD